LEEREEQAEAKETMREKYADVLLRLGSHGSLPPEEALEAEIERVATGVESYLKAYREEIRAETLYRVLNMADLPSEIADRFAELGKQADAARAATLALAEEHSEELVYLQFLLKLRADMAPEPKSFEAG
jgi:hypothetical protein